MKKCFEQTFASNMNFDEIYIDIYKIKYGFTWSTEDDWLSRAYQKTFKLWHIWANNSFEIRRVNSMSKVFHAHGFLNLENMADINLKVFKQIKTA